METILHKSIDAYYNNLANYGFAKAGERERLLLAVMITDYLRDEVGMLTDEESSVFEQFYICQFGKSCLLPYRAWLKLHFLDDESDCEECVSRPRLIGTPCTGGIGNADRKVSQPFSTELVDDGFWTTEENGDSFRLLVAVTPNANEHEDFITR